MRFLRKSNLADRECTTRTLQINGLFKRAFKYGCVKSVISLEQLLQDYDDKLFHKATYGNHAMHHLLSSLKSTGYNLRPLCKFY